MCFNPQLVETLASRRTHPPHRDGGALDDSRWFVRTPCFGFARTRASGCFVIASCA
jgi:hypothetical protein